MTPAPKPSLFVDASAWVALTYPREGNHKTALTFQKNQLTKTGRYGHVHTSTHTLAEAYTWLLHHASRRHALDLLTRAERGIHIHTTDAQLLWDAAALLRPKGAPPIELADAMNATLMSRLNIHAVWSYDSDYERLGYERMG